MTKNPMTAYTSRDAKVAMMGEKNEVVQSDLWIRDYDATKEFNFFLFGIPSYVMFPLLDLISKCYMRLPAALCDRGLME